MLFFSLSLPENNELRIKLGSANTLQAFKNIVVEIRDIYSPYHEGKLKWEQTTEEGSLNMVLPPWLCQPYVRIPPDEHLKKIEDHQDKSNDELVIFCFCIVSKLCFGQKAFCNKLNDSSTQC